MSSSTHSSAQPVSSDPQHDTTSSDEKCTKDDGETLPSDVLDYLESQAYLMARQLQSLAAGLQYQLQEMTQATLESVQAHSLAVERFDDQVETMINGASALITECDHLDRDIEPLYALSEQIKSFHPMLDALEQQLR